VNQKIKDRKQRKRQKQAVIKQTGQDLCRCLTALTAAGMMTSSLLHSIALMLQLWCQQTATACKTYAFISTHTSGHFKAHFTS